MKLVETSTNQATSIVDGLLRGAWIVGIEYWRTSWSITLSVNEDHPAVQAGLLAHPFELTLSTCQIDLVAAEAWAACFASAPVDVLAKPDHQDGPAALLLFNCVAYRMENTHVESSGDLSVSFTGGRQLLFSGDDWSIASKHTQNPSAFMVAEAGSLHVSPALLSSRLAASTE